MTQPVALKETHWLWDTSGVFLLMDGGQPIASVIRHEDGKWVGCEANNDLDLEFFTIKDSWTDCIRASEVLVRVQRSKVPSKRRRR